MSKKATKKAPAVTKPAGSEELKALRKKARLIFKALAISNKDLSQTARAWFQQTLNSGNIDFPIPDELMPARLNVVQNGLMNRLIRELGQYLTYIRFKKA